MTNQQLGNMAAKVEMVHIIHYALVLCVIDPGGESTTHNFKCLIEIKLKYVIAHNK